MEYYYSSEKNVQILVALLKNHNIRKIVASPGATNINFVASCQHDGFFEMYSEVDERNAVYLACGLSQASGEPVVVTCTGATASRNYFPGLTEAYYRKLPVLAVTASQDPANADRLKSQFVDRTCQPKDTVKMSVQLQYVRDEIDYNDCILKANKAILELQNRGGGPVHINLITRYENDLSITKLPDVRTIHRHTDAKLLPIIPTEAKVVLYIGAHKKFSDELETAIDRFCEIYDAPALCDLTSSYSGKHRVCASLLALQEGIPRGFFSPDLLVYIGENCGEYEVFGKLAGAKSVWRVSNDGKLHDTWNNLTEVFDMEELIFFNYYSEHASGRQESTICRSALINKEIQQLRDKIPELPFSNLWVSLKMRSMLPNGAMAFFGIVLTLRSWSLNPPTNNVRTFANVGGFGIDGSLSTAVGMALAQRKSLVFCFLGDLNFFYNMNALGNRNLPSNIRIMLFNDGCGGEFEKYNNRGQMLLGDDVKTYVAAEGHFGYKSKSLVKEYANSLGIEYLSATNKIEAVASIERFVCTDNCASPMLLEMFTDAQDESLAFKLAATAKYGYLSKKTILNNPDSIIQTDEYAGCRTRALFMKNSRMVCEHFVAKVVKLNAIWFRPVTWDNSFDENMKLHLSLKNDQEQELWNWYGRIADMPNNRWMKVDVEGVELEYGRSYNLYFDLSEIIEKSDYFQILCTDHFNRENGFAIVNNIPQEYSLCIAFE